MSRKYHTCYETDRARFAGLTLTKKSGGKDAAVFTVHAADLDGQEPRKGDRLLSADGVWHTVEKVGELEGGVYPLTCKQASVPGTRSVPTDGGAK